MSLFEKYACLYENTRFTAEEQAEIGEFVVGLMKCAAAGDRIGMARLFDKHFAYADDETMSKIGRVMFYFSKYGEPGERKVLNKYAVEEAMEKSAGIGSFLSKMMGGLKPAQPSLAQRIGGRMTAGARWVGSNLQPLMQGMLLTAITAPVVKASIDAVMESSRLKSSLATILKNHPELRNDPNVAQYFQMLQTFAPAAAANPLVAGNILMSLHETGPSFVTPQYIASLLQIQEKAQTLPPIQNQINEVARAMLQISKDVSPHGSKKVDINIASLPPLVGRISTR